MNLLATTTLLAVEQQAVKVGAEMARTGGPTEPEEVAEIGNMLRGLSLGDPIRHALRKGYLVGYASTTMGEAA